MEIWHNSRKKAPQHFKWRFPTSTTSYSYPTHSALIEPRIVPKNVSLKSWVTWITGKNTGKEISAVSWEKFPHKSFANTLESREFFRKIVSINIFLVYRARHLFVNLLALVYIGKCIINEDNILEEIFVFSFTAI